MGGGPRRVRIKIKRLKGNENGPLPKYMTEHAAGLDIHAFLDEDVLIAPGQRRLISTGLVVAVPDGFEIQVRPRSGLAMRDGVTLVNTPGTIDADYRGEIGVLMINHGEKPISIRNGQRIAQLVVSRVYKAELEEVDELPASRRQEGGFGHTGL
ncbi:MAG: dUTP diphosphatase [Syntrophobacterales bacterium]|nr:MAG: dUTP diphosphatase [Syntrophobacterales bacterium]